MLHARIDPIRTSENIRESYLRYLTTTLGLKNPELARQFRDLARHSEGLFRGPILEATPKYRQGKSLLDLVTEEQSILSDSFLDYAPGLEEEEIKERLSLERKLYSHQEKALGKIIGQNRNVVIATGTGSGKTECFLLPIIDHLLRERAAGRLGPGVRAMLLYPMNALANDQVIRLRRLLPPETGITFGRYTGQTQQRYYQGLDAYKQESQGLLPQANELFCRDQILGKGPAAKEWPHNDFLPFVGPPHILLTNFAMLEYLLMRPQDSALFDAGAGDTWRFIVLDEAHVYTGAQGTEIGFLIRRLKDRVCRSQKGKILCIATSATVGASDDISKKAVAESFQNLFDEEFEKEDVLTGDVVPPEKILGPFPQWGEGVPEFYEVIEDLYEHTISSMSALINAAHTKLLAKSSEKRAGWPDEKTVRKSIDAVRDLDNWRSARDALTFVLLAGDKRLRTLSEKLEVSPLDLPGAVAAMWDTTSDTADIEARKNILILLVDVASRARLTPDSAPLLAARYHYFVRSLEGLSLCLVKKKQN